MSFANKGEPSKMVMGGIMFLYTLIAATISAQGFIKVIQDKCSDTKGTKLYFLLSIIFLSFNICMRAVAHSLINFPNISRFYVFPTIGFNLVLLLLLGLFHGVGDYKACDESSIAGLNKFNQVELKTNPVTDIGNFKIRLKKLKEDTSNYKQDELFKEEHVIEWKYISEFWNNTHINEPNTPDKGLTLSQLLTKLSDIRSDNKEGEHEIFMTNYKEQFEKNWLKTEIQDWNTENKTEFELLTTLRTLCVKFEIDIKDMEANEKAEKMKENEQCSAGNIALNDEKISEFSKYPLENIMKSFRKLTEDYDDLKIVYSKNRLENSMRETKTDNFNVASIVIKSLAYMFVVQPSIEIIHISYTLIDMMRQYDSGSWVMFLKVFMVLMAVLFGVAAFAPSKVFDVDELVNNIGNLGKKGIKESKKVTADAADAITEEVKSS